MSIFVAVEHPGGRDDEPPQGNRFEKFYSTAEIKPDHVGRFRHFARNAPTDIAELLK